MRNDMQQKVFSRTQSGNVTVHSQKVAGPYICQKELYKNNSAPLKKENDIKMTSVFTQKGLW